MKTHIAYPPLRPFIGGAIVAAAVYLLHADRYIGLRIPVIVDAFQHPLAPWDFLGKLAFTVTSLGKAWPGW
jgi:H+/Cl- antiporter ClcA